MRSLPFNEVDEAVHILDAEAAPWSVHLEMRLSGSLDETKLRAALRGALSRHPLARARKAPSKGWDRGWTWEIPDEPDLDPLRALECPTDAAVSAARAELQSRLVPLTESPPFRMRLARHANGDVLMLNANHAAFDGTGCVRLLHSVARAYSGEDDPTPDVDIEQVHDLRQALRAPDRKVRARRYRLLLEKLRDLLGAPARVAPEDSTPSPGYGFHQTALTPEETGAIVGAERGQATVNDVLLAALHLAIERWNSEHGVRRHRIGVLVPVDLRPPEIKGEIVGNFVLPVRVSTKPRDQVAAGRVLATVAAQTRRLKEQGTAAALIEALAWLASVPVWAKQVLPALLPITGNRLVDTAQLSNLGRINRPPSFGHEAGETRELWFSPPARMPLGLSIGAVTVARRLHLVFRYRLALFGADAAVRFAALYLDELMGFATKSKGEERSRHDLAQKL